MWKKPACNGASAGLWTATTLMQCRNTIVFNSPTSQWGMVGGVENKTGGVISTTTVQCNCYTLTKTAQFDGPFQPGCQEEINVNHKHGILPKEGVFSHSELKTKY